MPTGAIKLNDKKNRYNSTLQAVIPIKQSKKRNLFLARILSQTIKKVNRRIKKWQIL